MKDMTLKEMLAQKREARSEEPAMDLSPIKALFKEDEPMPEIDESQAGKIRLLMMLRKKFGAGYKAIPQVKEALEHYHKEARFIDLYKRTSEANRGRRN